MKYNKCTVISECGCNHQGDIDIAKEMIRQAKFAGSDYVKFQKRDIDSHPEWKTRPYNSENSFGKTYYDHRKYLEFSLSQHKELQRICMGIGIGYSSSVWDEDSALEIISLNPDFIKVPSAMNENYKLLDTIFNNYQGDVHISLGMISKKDKEKLYEYLEDKKDRIVMYHTTSGYPVKFEELYLMEIMELKNRFNRVGFSGHHLGIAADISAATLGAEWIERHFTLDRTAKGTDNSASLEPTGLQKLCRDLNAVYRSLTYKNIDLTEDEKRNSEKLKIVVEK